MKVIQFKKKEREIEIESTGNKYADYLLKERTKLAWQFYECTDLKKKALLEEKVISLDLEMLRLQREYFKEKGIDLFK